MGTPLVNNRNRGFVLVTVLLLLAVISSLVASYMVLSTVEFGTVRASKDSEGGFNAAEAGLNIRAETIRDKFIGYNTPSGTTPSSTDPCEGSNNGSGDFACQTHSLGKQNATTYVKQLTDPNNPPQVTIPTGELYQHLNAIEYKYDVQSVAKSTAGDTEAMLSLRFKSLLIPLFQFAAFYNKDLEMLPGADMVINGPIHTNGDLYQEAGGSYLRMDGQVTTAASYYRGRKNANTCTAGAVQVKDPSAYRTVPNTSGVRKKIDQSSLTAWNGMIQTGVSQVTVPAPEDLDPTPGKTYWDKADLRLVLVLNASNNPDTSTYPTAIQIRNADNTVDATRTAILNGNLSSNMGTCRGNSSAFGIATTGESPTVYYRPVAYTNTYCDNRESATNIKMLDVDLKLLFNCVQVYKLLDKVGSADRLLSDDTEGGLVIFMTVKGPNSNAVSSKYGIRVRDGSEIKSDVAGAPAIKGLTIVSDQPAYIYGNYNSTNKKPAAFLVDAINIISNNWTSDAARGCGACSSRPATATTVNAAFLAGTTTTGNIEGTGGQGGAYNGGLENFPRFNESWTGIAFTYTGSLVSLNKPRHTNSAWPGTGGNYYNAPTRIWAYDSMFNDASKLPPLSPRFVYLRQQLFVRDYEIDE